MTTYYVKNGGSDTADGLSEANAWETLSKVNGFSFSDNDVVLLRHGHIWREQLTVPHDHITFGPYDGAIPEPVISGANVLTNASFSLTDDTQITHISDTFNRDDGAGWGTADGGTDTDTSWSIEYGTGDIASNHAYPTNTWSSAIGIVGDSNTLSREFYGEFSGVSNESDTRAVGFYVRYQQSDMNLRVDYTRFSGELRIVKSSHINPWSYKLAVQSISDPGASLTIRAIVYNIDRDVVIKARVWQTGQSEPSTWQLTYTDEFKDRNGGIPPCINGQFGAVVVNAGTKSCYLDNFSCKSAASSYAHTYEYSLTTDPGSFVIEDGISLDKMNDISGVECNPGSFYWASNVLYVHASDSSSPITNNKVYEAPYRNLAVDPNGKSNIEYRNINFSGAKAQTLFQASSDSVTLWQCTADNIVYEGVPMGTHSRLGAKMGFHQDLIWYETSYHQQRVEQAAEIGMQVSRNSFLWKIIEGTQGVKDWSRPDNLLNLLEACGVEPVFVFVGSPQWANGSSDEHVIPTGGDFTTWVTNYTTWATAAATRYAGRVKKWELWNEANDEYFWKPAPSIANYITWADSVYDAVKSVDSSNEVVIGGLTSPFAGGTNCLEAVTEFLPGLYDNTFYADGVAIHPYQSSNADPYTYAQYDNAYSDICEIYKVMEEYNRESDLLWMTEHGWTTATVSEANQSLYLVESYKMLKEYYPQVSLCTIFLDEDASNDEYKHGMFDKNHVRKKSARTFQEWVGLFGIRQKTKGAIYKSKTISITA